jgi:hypothetical protein
VNWSEEKAAVGGHIRSSDSSRISGFLYARLSGHDLIFGLEGLRKIVINFSEGGRLPNRVSYAASPKYEAGLLNNRKWISKINTLLMEYWLIFSKKFSTFKKACNLCTNCDIIILRNYLWFSSGSSGESFDCALKCTATVFGPNPTQNYVVYPRLSSLLNW